jgi:hypothetical protein
MSAETYYRFIGYLQNDSGAVSEIWLRYMLDLKWEMVEAEQAGGAVCG